MKVERPVTEADPTRRFFARDTALFVGSLPPASLHTHHALQGCLALDGPVRVEDECGEAIRASAVLIGPDVPHAVTARGRVAHFYATPESEIGGRLRVRLAGRPMRSLPERGWSEIRAGLTAALADDAGFATCLERMLALAAGDAPAAPPGDARVRAALAALRTRSPDIPLAELAREAGLSPDRLRHLLREQTGLSLRRHRRWARLMGAVAALPRSGNVTDAAHAAGFADAAHLCRVFRDSFTIPPGEFLRDSRFVQAGRSERA